MDSKLYITGHRNPDSDSICAAIAYADLKKKLGIAAIPARLGDINRETEFILSYFNMPVPEYLETVKTQVSDLNLDPVIPISPDVSIKTAWMVMKKNNLKTLPVIDDGERLIGIVTISDITSKYMDTLETSIISSSNTPLRNIVETLNARIIYGSQDIFVANGNVVVGALSPDNLEHFLEEKDIVIVGDREDVQLKAIELGANCIIVTGGFDASDQIVKEAEKHECIVMTTPYDTFTASRLINQSLPIKHIMTTENIISFQIDDFVDEIKEKMLQTRYRSYPVVDDRQRIIGFVARYHLISQKKKKVILVDHNERNQSVNGIEEAEILEIIDHHRVADVTTGRPIYFRNEPVGSTSTIIANIFFENGIHTSRSIAGILCAAIISDTLKFQSPTCTYVDKITAEKLASIAGIDIDEFATKMFKAGTSLKGKTPEEIFYQDFKEFKIGKYRIGISQVNTMDSENMDEIKQELLEYMNHQCSHKDFDLMMILLTDIIKQGSEILFTGESKELIAKAFNVNSRGSSVFLPGVISRKKQVVPPLSMAAEQ